MQQKFLKIRLIKRDIKNNQKRKIEIDYFFSIFNNIFNDSKNIYIFHTHRLYFHFIIIQNFIS